MNRLARTLSAWITITALLSNAFLAQAQTVPPASLCKIEGTVLVFFNGVLTTEAQAISVREELRRIHGDKLPNGEDIRYETMYNKSNGLEDFVETFDQRMKEQNGILAERFELFFESINGGGSWWTSIVGSIAAASQLLDALSDSARSTAIRNLTTLLANPPTAINYQEHRSRIDNYVVEGKKLLFVAHSQGNLFVNPAYNYAVAKMPSSAIKVVHIAPASGITNGPYFLADLDLVINGLRLLGGTVKDITDPIPGYLLRPAGSNGLRDIKGHGILEIYINQSMQIATKVKTVIDGALASLVTPPVQGTSGFFSATLTWNGTGDVDTHVFEPDGTHVYYQAKQGHAGYLDVDNTIANGPEHYYASCSADKLQTGNYKVAVANYSGADGRTASVQIASYSEGVLGTRSVTLGGATGNTPSTTLFTVNVTKDNVGRYKATILN